MKVSLVPQSCLSLCNPMDCSPPGSSVHRISQARILEWVAISYPGYLPNPGIDPSCPTLQADSLPSEPPGKPTWLRWVLNRTSPGSAVSKESACQRRKCRRRGLVPGSGRSPGIQNGNPLQYSCRENSVDRGAWWATIYGATKSWTQLSVYTHTCI